MTTVEFLAAGGNRHPSAADWASDLLAFGAGNNIALWNPEDECQNGVFRLLKGHTDVVNAVKIFTTGKTRHIITGSADKTIRIWTSPADQSTTFEQRHCLTEHQGSINSIATLTSRDIIATGSADGIVKIWTFSDTSVPQCLQTIELKPRILPLTLALAELGTNQVVLAVAGTNTAIQLYVQTAGQTDFLLQATLTGHEGWVRSLDFTKDYSSNGSNGLLLASASQDKFIRLWRISALENTNGSFVNGASSLANSAVTMLSNKTYQIGGDAQRFAVSFEALLVGHEDWVYTARWAPRKNVDAPPTLLSASADNSLAVWNADIASSVWVCDARLGEISAQKGSTTATGSTGGFWIGLWQPDGHAVVSLGRTGSWRRWTAGGKGRTWSQQLGVTGHVEEIRSLAWSTDGSYLLSTGADQTTRLWAEWVRENTCSWHEMSRPQIHGYDLNCVDSLHHNRFISGADEKLLRVFNKPKAVDNLLARTAGIDAIENDLLPDAANMPVLGLSNKAITAIDDEGTADETLEHDSQDNVDPSSIVHKSTLDLDSPPFEDHLARHTLWPEHEKLYGHGYEISAVAAGHTGSVVATACKASSIDHAVIRIYEQNEWREVKPPLTAHGLTVTSLAFSKDDRYLLSVGRDRQWALFVRSASSPTQYQSFTVNPKGHSRMILDCSWAATTDAGVFATAGRDKMVKIWQIQGDSVHCAATITADTPVTAIAFDSSLDDKALRLAYGTEDGQITLAELAVDTLAVLKSSAVSTDITASKAVTRLSWRPQTREGKHGSQLAIASDDFALRILNVD